MKSTQAGFSVVLMLALIVVLGGMLAYAVSVASSRDAAIAQQVGVTRAQSAALAGFEWAQWRVRVPAAPTCIATTNLTIPFASGAMPVTVQCTLTGVHTEGGTTVRTYGLVATACQPASAGTCPNPTPSADYVERVVTGSAER